MNKILQREFYNNLDIEDKKKILLDIAEKYNLKIKEFKEFSRWGKSIYTAIYDIDGIEFVFVPGDSVILGWEKDFDKFYNEIDENTYDEFSEFVQEIINLNEIENYDLKSKVYEFLNLFTTNLRKTTIKPMLVQRNVSEIELYREVDIENIKDDNILNYIRNFEKNRVYDKQIILGKDSKIRLRRIKEEIKFEIYYYEDFEYNKFKNYLMSKEGFSLPTIDDWEYLCGGGCRSLFQWGDNFDFNINIDENINELEEPNFFGISIGYDPYILELLNENQFALKGGDGGCNCCGGSGFCLSYFPCSPYYKVDCDIFEDDKLDNDFVFMRRIKYIDL